MKVFLSHSWSDKALVTRFGEDLVRAGVDIWIDNAQIGPGASIPQSVSDGLKAVDYVLAFISSNFLKSEWSKWETNSTIASSIATKKLRLIPILIEDVWNDVAPLLRDKRYIDLRAHANLLVYRAALDAVLALAPTVTPGRVTSGRLPVITVTGGRRANPHQLAVASALGEMLGFAGYQTMTGVAVGVDVSFSEGVRRGHARSGRYARDQLTCWTNRDNKDIQVKYGRILESRFRRREEGVPELVSDADIGVFIGGGKNTQYLAVLMLLENRIILPIGATKDAAGDLTDLLLVRSSRGGPGVLERAVYDDLRDLGKSPQELAQSVMNTITRLAR